MNVMTEQERIGVVGRPATQIETEMGLAICNLQDRVQQLEALLRKLRAARAVDTALWEADLINQIDEVVKP